MANQGMISIGDFRGGLNVADDPKDIAASQATVLKNFDLSVGKLTKRGGYKRVGDVRDVISGLARVRFPASTTEEKVWTTQADWESGTSTQVDLTNQPGALKLEFAGGTGIPVTYDFTGAHAGHTAWWSIGDINPDQKEQATYQEQPETLITAGQHGDAAAYTKIATSDDSRYLILTDAGYRPMIRFEFTVA